MDALSFEIIFYNNIIQFLDLSDYNTVEFAVCSAIYEGTTGLRLYTYIIPNTYNLCSETADTYKSEIDDGEATIHTRTN